MRVTLLRLALATSAILCAAIVSGPAFASTVRATPQVQGSGTVTDGAAYSCVNGNQDDRQTKTDCALQVVVDDAPWSPVVSITYTANPSSTPSGHWRFAGWTGCSSVAGNQCTVSSPVYGAADFTPHAIFDDFVAPTVTAPVANQSSLTEKTFSYTFGANETVTYGCRFDNTTFIDCTSGISKTFATEGWHTFDVRAFDASGNVSSIETATVRVIDTAVIAAPGGISNSRDATFSYTTQAGISFECSLDNAAYTACPGAGGSGQITYVGLTETAHTFRVRARDGQWFDRIAPVQTWYIDATPPTTELSHATTSAHSRIATFQAGTDGGVSFQCRLIGPGQTGVYSACGATKSYNDLADGTYTFEVRAVDEAANVDPTPSSHTWTIDFAAPSFPAITSGPAAVTASANAVLTFTGSPDTTAFRCSLDGAPAADCASPLSYAGLADSLHVLTVTAVDAYGNESLPAIRTWTVDTLAPNAKLLRGPAARTTSHTAAFRFASTEAGSTFECKLDRGKWTACNSPKTYRKLKLGLHTFQVRARDVAGNVDATPAKKTWRIR